MDCGLLSTILEEVRSGKKCHSCLLKEKRQPLIFEPDREVRVMAITYGPNRTEDPEIIASLANHPTYTYLSALFGGNFRPEKDATAYWTHLRKCFIKDENGKLLITNFSEKTLDRKAREVCSREYLTEEIKAVQPELILAVGEEVVNFLSSISEDDRLKDNFKDVFLRQYGKGMLDNVKLKMGLTVNVAVVPHPSGRSRFFVNSSMEEKEKIAEILESIRKNILKAIQ